MENVLNKMIKLRKKPQFIKTQTELNSIKIQCDVSNVTNFQFPQ